MATFNVDEIQATFDAGQRVAAVKMLRAETGCGLKEAMDSLKARTIAEMPTFAEIAARKRVERAAPALLADAKALVEYLASIGRLYPLAEKLRETIKSATA